MKLIILIAIILLTYESPSFKIMDDLLGIPSSGGAQFHPFKNEIVYSSNELGRIQLFKVKHDGKKITSFPESKKKIKKRAFKYK